MKRIRIEYSKKGYMRFIGHLDTMRIFFRALRRAKIPVVYTQGFSPRIKSSSSPPLPLVFSSSSEYIDIFLEDEKSQDVIARNLRGNLPSGLEIMRVYPGRNISPNRMKKRISARGRFVFGGDTSDEISNRVYQLPPQQDGNHKVKEILYEIDLSPLAEYSDEFSAIPLRQSESPPRQTGAFGVKDKIDNFIKSEELMHYNEIKEIKIMDNYRMNLKMKGLANPRKVLARVIGLKDEDLLGCGFKRVKIYFAEEGE